MKTGKNAIDKNIKKEEANKWPVAITFAFLMVFIGSFMPWGTIRYHYTFQFMANLEHPGLCNRIITDDDLSGIKIGTKLNYTGSAWKSGFDILGLFYPHWLLTALALFLFVFSLFRFFDFFYVNPSVPQIVSYYGLLHVSASAWGFFSQGSIKSGLILTGLGYLIFTVSFLRWK